LPDFGDGARLRTRRLLLLPSTAAGPEIRLIATLTAPRSPTRRPEQSADKQFHASEVRAIMPALARGRTSETWPHRRLQREKRFRHRSKHSTAFARATATPSPGQVSDVAASAGQRRHDRAQPRTRENCCRDCRVVGVGDLGAGSNVAISRDFGNCSSGRSSRTPSRSETAPIAASPAMPLPRNIRINSVLGLIVARMRVTICGRTAGFRGPRQQAIARGARAAGNSGLRLAPVQRSVRCGRSSARARR